MQHKQNVNDFSEVEKCVLQPIGTFYIKIRKIKICKFSATEVHFGAIAGQLAALTIERKQLRIELAARG